MQYRAYIDSVGFHIPVKRMANDEFSAFVDTSDEWIFSHTGIRYRHIANADETTSELAVAAARHALRNANIDTEGIDCIIVATSTADYNHFPSAACIVQQKIGIERPIPSFDVSAACSGFIYGLSIADAFVVSGKYKHILLIGSEVFSKILDWNDRGTCVLFGDGAGAAVISQSTTESRIADSILYADGQHYGSLTCEPKEKEPPHNSPTIRMAGKPVYLFAVKALHDVINTILERNKLTMDDIKWIIPHQANVRIIDAACKRGGFDRKRFYVNIDKYANTSAASVPIALAEMDQKNLLRRGDALITVGFGAGLSYGANLIYW